MEGRSVFSDYLAALGVPHTGGYSDAAFRDMGFRSLFGFSRLLKSYGIGSRGLRFDDKSRLTSVPVPFLAQMKEGPVVVNAFSRDGAGGEQVEYTVRHRKMRRPLDDFIQRWSGIVLQAFPADGSSEPDYMRHRFLELAADAKKWLLLACAAVLFVYGFVSAGLWRNLSTILLVLVNLAGIGVTWLLVLKSLKVSSRSADRICGVLQEHGCDTVLEQKASSFFGLFGWSEVGITYFSVSMLVLLLFPGMMPWLALANGCCLPFTVWSIWYQKFRIHTWCTLCVTTQCLLWLQFFCYLGGGWWSGVFPVRWPFLLLGCAYVTVLLAVNRVMEFVKGFGGLRS